MVGAGLLAFGAGVAVGVLASQAWGWHGWNTDWHHHHVIYQNNVYVSNTNNFASVNRYGGGNRGGNFNRPAGNNAGGPQRGARPVYKANAPANPPAYANRQAANRGSGQMGIPAQAHPAAGARPAYKANAPANPPAYANRQAANRGSGQMGIPAQAHPAAGARPAYKPNVPAPPSVRNEPKPQASQPNPYRGFAKAPATGLNKTAFARVAPGGEAIAASARGRASLGRAPQPARAAPPAHAAARPAPRAAPAARPAANATHKH
jgi:hypothetical protein